MRSRAWNRREEQAFNRPPDLQVLNSAPAIEAQGRLDGEGAVGERVRWLTTHYIERAADSGPIEAEMLRHEVVAHVIGTIFTHVSGPDRPAARCS